MTSLAVAYLRTKQNGPAKELLTSAIDSDPDNSDAYQYLGFCHLRFYEQARDEYKEVPETADNKELLAGLKRDMSSFVDKSINSYNKAIEINDKDWQAHRGLGVAYMVKSTVEEDKSLKNKAVKQWKMSLEIKPDQPNRERLLKVIKRYSKK